MSKILAFLKALEGLAPLAEIIAKFLERLIPGDGKGQIKKELGMEIMTAAQSDADPMSFALDLAVQKLNATKGWDEPNSLEPR